jgi:predicted HAD superfamily Cof-like phosphohydrolase
MNIEKIINWFKAAKPNPTEKDKATQIGAHFEEVSEMMRALSCDSKQAECLSEVFYTSPAIDKDIDGEVMKLPENWEIDLLDSLCDQIVTAIGVGYMMGFDMVGALKEVNLSNWSKFDENGNPIFNENGKIVKGENYFKPDLAKFVRSNNAPAAE